MATTIQVPLELLTVNLADANAYWNVIDDTNFDWGGVFFASATAAKAYWHGIVPKNLAGTPAWNLFMHCNQTSGSGASAATFAISAKDFASGDTKRGASLAALFTCATASIGASATHSIINLANVSGGSANFDNLEAVSAGNELIVEVIRYGADAGDAANLMLITNLVLQVDVT